MRIEKILVVISLSYFLIACGAVQSYRYTQMINDEQKLTRLYRECIEKNYGNPKLIKQYCEPIIAPLRITKETNKKITR